MKMGTAIHWVNDDGQVESDIGPAEAIRRLTEADDPAARLTPPILGLTVVDAAELAGLRRDRELLQTAELIWTQVLGYSLIELLDRIVRKARREHKHRAAK
jgi:hypothetical protein